MTDTLAAGKIQFLSHAQPGLDAGTYQLTASQTLTAAQASSGLGSSRTYTYQQSVVVRAPRFRFGPADVHSVYPAPLSEGEFGDTIPHIVLRRRTLPWERTIDGQPFNSANVRPWLALLVFRESELNAVQVQTGAVKDLVLPQPAAIPANVQLPQFDFSGARAVERTLELDKVNQADPQVTTIDVGKDLFATIAPRIAELRLLAHVRHVNTGDKELLGMVEDGWFSLVLANRVPGVGGNVAHLVSLDGCESVLNQAAAGTIAKDKVRLVSLASWKFSSRASLGNFREIANNLSVSMLQFKPPQTLESAALANPDQAYLLDALNNGYVPLTYRMRSGDLSAAWYRGPFTPKPAPLVERDPFPTSEAGLIYDQQRGLFDVSNAVAWQIGRLLALSDARFAAALGEWRQQGQILLDKMIHQAQTDRARQEDSIWRKIGEIQAITDLNERKARLLDLLRDTDLVKSIAEDLAKPDSTTAALAGKVLADYENLGPQGSIQAPQDTKAKLTDGIANLLDAAYREAAGKSGIFAAAAFRDQLLKTP